MDGMKMLNRAIAPIVGRIRLMVGRGIIRLADDARQVQEVQVELLDQESHDGVERFQHYGFTSNPHDGAEAILVFPGGVRSHGIVIACEDRRYRLKNLEAGEAALYDDLGNLVKLGRDRIEIEAVTEIKVSSPKAIIESDDIHLGAEGGEKVARVGDDVDLGTGKILTGSDKVKAG
jgi:phage baseplate assembly protein V